MQIMAIPIEQDGRGEQDPDDVFFRNLDTRLAGGQVLPASESNQVLVFLRHTDHSWRVLTCTLGYR